MEKNNNLDNSVNETINESINNYLNDLDFVFGGVISRYNFAKQSGIELYKDINTTNKDNSVISYTCSESVRLHNKEYELCMFVCDHFATVNLFEAIEKDDYKFNEITIDIYKRDNVLTMYALKNTRRNNDGLRIDFDKIEMLPELCDDYEIDFKSYKTQEGSLINGVNIFNKKKSIKKLKMKK